MPTDNPKISLYVPQQVFDRFKSFQEEKKLSMSQAGIVILAEYFGLEETIKEITEGTTIGGVTLAEFDQLKERVKQLEKIFVSNQKISEDQLGKEETTSKLPVKSKVQNSKPQLELLSEPLVIEPVTGYLLSKRFGMSKNAPSERKKKYNSDKFAEWSQAKDPDGIAWIPVEKGYAPKDKLPEELLGRLRDWIAQNT